MPAERTYASPDGLSLFYRDLDGFTRDGEAARGVPVLCLPGLTRNGRDFDELAAHVGARRRVLCPDLRGRGGSAWDPTPANYVPGTYLGDVHALLEAAGAPRVVVVGTSLGGLLAMMLAATRPEAVAGVVLNDIGPEIDPRGLERIQGYVGKGAEVATWEEAAAAMRETNDVVFPDFDDADWLRMAERTYARGDDGLLRPDYDPRISEPFSEPGGEAPAADLWVLWAALAAVPALVVRGETSDILAASTLERMKKEKPDLQTVTVPRVGHAPLLTEAPCVAAIDAFLDGLGE